MKTSCAFTIMLSLSACIVGACSDNTSVSIHYKDSLDIRLEYVAIATMTMAAYQMETPASAKDQFWEIPEIYWHEDIKEMAPIRVYQHKNNLAIVLYENEHREAGIYVYVPSASYLPQNDTTIEFVAINRNTYEFVRHTRIQTI